MQGAGTGPGAPFTMDGNLFARARGGDLAAASCGVHDPADGAELIPAHRAITACRLQFVVQQVAWRNAGGADTG
jgi:hypothetical protein